MGLQKYRIDLVGEPQKNGCIPCYTRWMMGETLALVRNCPIENADFFGRRTVYVRGEPDTFFSLPAACEIRWHGRRWTLTGYITTNEECDYVFRVHSRHLSNPIDPESYYAGELHLAVRERKEDIEWQKLKW